MFLRRFLGRSYVKGREMKRYHIKKYTNTNPAMINVNVLMNFRIFRRRDGSKKEAHKRIPDQAVSNLSPRPTS